jgi:hypothetical protein
MEEKEKEPGFYKQEEGGTTLYAPNYVYAPTYTLLKEEKDNYDYPVDGWSWHEDNPFI